MISLASGRIVEIDARLGDTVTKGQLLLKVQSQDIAQAFSDYRQAVADEALAKAQLERAKVLLEKGAIAKKDEEVAEDADIKARVTVETAVEHLKVLGADMDHPSSIIEIHAPVSGVITDQQVTASAGVKTLDNSPNLFTISDLSKVWIICDVYENDMSFVRVGEYADIHLAAYPNVVLKGAHRQHCSDAGSQYPDRESAPGSGQLRACCASGCSSPRRSMDRKSNCAPRCRRRRSCICTIATGYTRRMGTISSAASKWWAGTCCQAGCRRLLPGSGQGSRWYRTHWFCNPRLSSSTSSSMIRKVVDFALNNRFVVLAIALLLLAWGAISFHNLPVEAYPDVANNYVDVITQWPGISAEQIEQQVTIPLEIAMNGIPRRGASALLLAVRTCRT